MKSEGRIDILIIGDATTGSGVSETLIGKGFRVARADVEGYSHRSRVGGAIVVQAGERGPEFEALGLEPGNRVVALSDFLEALPDIQPFDKSGGPAPLVVFLLGLAGESSCRATRDALAASSVLLDDLGRRVAMLYGNLKVSAAGLEAEVREARRKGALLLRFSSARPTFVRNGEGRPAVECLDEASRRRLILHPDWIVKDEILRAGPGDLERAARLGAEPGPDGFLPSDNVYRFGLETNRRGILGIIPDADPLGRDTLEDDLAAAMLEMRALDRFDSWAPDRVAVIDPGLCARCLTCHRSCPHGAVAVGERIEIVPQACFACGICEAACPAKAITLRERDPEKGPLEAVPRPVLLDIRPGDLVTFGCRRSAERARALCGHLGAGRPADLVFVPVDCAGRISREMLMDAFLQDASGVLVLTCHPGNCHAEKGNLQARSRVGEVRRFLEEAGLNPERVRFNTLAANMGVEFGRMVREFKAELDQR
ncbi:MAG: hydrogenase iron-sulfur subunit [Deltaproteobacteria bacterium]|nr:hydrogenase iron-sulfur subunit [Deltaproteobacteria bacterium]